MDHDISHRPSYAQLTLSLDAGESVRAEGGTILGFLAYSYLRYGR